MATLVRPTFTRTSLFFRLVRALAPDSLPAVPADDGASAPAPLPGFRRPPKRGDGLTVATRCLKKGDLRGAFKATQAELERREIGPKRRRRYQRRAERLSRALVGV